MITLRTARSSRLPAMLSFAGVICLAVLLPLWREGAVTGLEKIQSLGGGRYLITEERSVSAKGYDQLHFSSPPNLSGHIVMTVGGPDSVHVRINKVLRVESAQIAAELDAEIEVELTTAGSSVRMDVRTPRGARWERSNWSVMLDLTVTIPSGWDLDFDTRHLEYDLTGPFRDVVIATEFGRVKLSQVTRRVDVRGRYTGIELADVKGEIVAKTDYADLDIRRAIPDVDQPARLANTNGPITVTELAGALVVETQYAPIRLEKISLLGSTSRVLGENAPVDCNVSEFARARLEIESSYAPVRLQVPSYLSARLDITVGSGGTIRTSGLEIQTHPDLLGRQRLEGVCGSGDGIIDIRASGASFVELTGQ